MSKVKRSNRFTSKESGVWARIRIKGPTLIFDFHQTKFKALRALAKSARKYGPRVYKIQNIVYFPYVKIEDVNDD